ncbi:MAG: response regulator [Deltaproteobacteria bacterium]|nr:response regulator [Deltaproteobacteria bacterium]MBL7205529.1 response regulator [Desulfobacteraceae bacterium]
MSVITIFSGSFCKEDLVIRDVLVKTGYKLVTDMEIVAEASRFSGIAEAKISQTFWTKTSVFNKFTHEKEHSIAHLRLAIAEMLSGDNLLISGFSSQLIPKEVSHVLRICLIADIKFRILEGTKEHGMHEKDILKLIQKNDGDRAVWISTLFQKKDPWDSELYDMVIPVDKTSVEEIAALIKKNADIDVVRPTDRSKNAVEDFLLGAKVGVALANEGHNVNVKAKDRAITLTINKHVLMLSRLEEELKSIAGKVPGVKSVETRVGADFYQTDVYRKYDFEMPSRVLLVDDEREFVQALSERLLIRDMGSTVAYDGESALSLIKEDEPEVMILDLKMPGIDGIEVLRRVKETNPEIEVIILTGHGSEEDKRVCMDLGAFAYLHKPVDIDVLSETLKKANEKVKRKKDQIKH